ncbi:MAG TPA: 50S ribosomal protein L11 methyltransferase [Methyloceanibacter sp.]|nr:50S ribosomal protein L11 methyltransferase [Methyloceanibacter sp.]
MSEESATAAYQVTLLGEAGEAEAIASRLEETIEPRALAVSLFDRGMGRFEVSALYAERPHEDALVAALDGAAHGAVSIEPLAAADWVTLSQGKRGPVQAGRFLAHGSHDRDRVPKRRLAIEIDAGQAFGTAHHASTRGCLLALDDLLKRERPRVILDVGTGTGILAIAAAKVLQCPVLASDEDRLAAAIAAANARKNRAGALISTVTARGFAHPSLRRLAADLLLANLVERALYALAPELARRVKPGGTAILSGLTQTQARTIEARNSAFGFILEKRIVLDGWTTLMLRRRKGRAVGD